jgi:hypothetical protein
MTLERRLWTGVIAAPAAWIAQGALGWYFGYEACGGWTPAGARIAVAVLSALALVAALAGWSVAWRTWGRVAAERRPFDVTGWDRVEFMSAGGVLVSSIFIIAIVWAALSALLLRECGGMR